MPANLSFQTHYIYTTNFKFYFLEEDLLGEKEWIQRKPSLYGSFSISYFVLSLLLFSVHLLASGTGKWRLKDVICAAIQVPSQLCSAFILLLLSSAYLWLLLQVWMILLTYTDTHTHTYIWLCLQSAVLATLLIKTNQRSHAESVTIFYISHFLVSFSSSFPLSIL